MTPSSEFVANQVEIFLKVGPDKKHGQTSLSYFNDVVYQISMSSSSDAIYMIDAIRCETLVSARMLALFFDDEIFGDYQISEIVRNDIPLNGFNCYSKKRLVDMFDGSDELDAHNVLLSPWQPCKADSFISRLIGYQKAVRPINVQYINVFDDAFSTYLDGVPLVKSSSDLKFVIWDLAVLSLADRSVIAAAIVEIERLNKKGVTCVFHGYCGNESLLEELKIRSLHNYD